MTGEVKAGVPATCLGYSPLGEESMKKEFLPEGLNPKKTFEVQDMVNLAHAQSTKSGFWGDDGKKEYNASEKLMLMVSELAEALEEARSKRAVNEVYYNRGVLTVKLAETVTDDDITVVINSIALLDGVTSVTASNAKKPEGFPMELADCVIRIGDICGREGIDLQACIEEKMAFNASRPYKHGRAF